MILSSLLLATMAPIGDPGAWISPSDYPVDALRDKVEGAVTVQLEIDSQGTPTNCSIIASSGSASLDATSCSLLVERARFQPKQNGQKVFYQTRIQWKIPEAKLTPVTLQGFTAFSNFENGKPVGHCVEEVVGKPIEILPLCELMSEPEALAILGLNSGPSIKALQLQFIVAPREHVSVRSARFDMTARHSLLLNLVFEVNADGTVTNCDVLHNAGGEALNGICSEFESGVADFDVSGASQFPVAMKFVVDALAK